MHGSVPAVLVTFFLSLFISCFAAAQSQRVEAEHYTDMSGVQLESATDEGGGSNVGWIEEDDWILYDIPLAAGEYRFSYRVASYGGDERFHLQSGDGQETYSIVAFGSTGDWQS